MATTIKARHVVCAVGTFKTFDPILKALDRHGEGATLDTEYSILKPDPRMPDAFDACRDRRNDTWKAEDTKAVKAHKSVAYILSPPLSVASAKTISRKMLGLIPALFKAGATAIKGESAGIAHGRAGWLKLAKQRAKSEALCDAWVRYPIYDEEDEVLYSCGLHLLGLPDVEVAEGYGAEYAVLAINRIGRRMLLSGETAGLARVKAAGLGFKRTKCKRYEEDEFFYNPRGYVRLS